MSFLNKEEFENVANNIESGNIPPFVMIDNYVEDIGEHYNFKEVYTKLSDVGGNTFDKIEYQQKARGMLECAYRISKSWFIEKFKDNRVMDIRNMVDKNYQTKLLKNIPNGVYTYME